jgi:hypothetical protein
LAGIEENSPESYFPTYKGKCSPSNKADSPFLPCFQPPSATVACDLSQSCAICSAIATPAGSEDNSPALAFQPDSGNDVSYDAVRIGSQKRKAWQISADSSASDLSVIFSPRKKAKSKTKLEALADELMPYQQILVNLKKHNEKKYQKKIKQLIQNLKDKEFLQSSMVDVMIVEV